MSAGWNFEHSYAEQLPPRFYTRVQPTPVSAPKLILLNRGLATYLGLDAAELARPENAGWFAGNSIPPGAAPIAQAYAGHQFGNFVILGDGRAILLGEQMTARGERFDVQLKGPGRTPYSRGGDGRAALGPMLREYIISEAMRAFGIPTTRSLAVASTGERVLRETTLPGAILTRVAASHIRVGTFEWAAATGETENIRALADYTIGRHYPELVGQETRYKLLLESVMQRQAKLIAQWQHVGFIHGVMNTDNMALSGETIDYGPCAFMDAFHPETVFSSIDRYGRYAYGNQPKIAHWNLARLAAATLPLLHDNEDEAVEVANGLLEKFPEVFDAYWLQGIRAKLGLFNEEPGDRALAENLLTIMREERMEFTNTFRDLTRGRCEGSDDLKGWLSRWRERLTRQSQVEAEVRGLMRRSNPAVIPRNHKVEEALAAAVAGDIGQVENLLEVVTKPYDHERDLGDYSSPAPASDEPYQTFCGT